MYKLLCGVFMHIFIILMFTSFVKNSNVFNIFRKPTDSSERKYGNFPESLRLQMLSEAKKMFYFGYDNYMEYGFPLDELNPILCSGRGPDFANPSNLNINDILGDFCLTLVDSLDTLAVLGNVSEFQYAVAQVIENVNFDKDNVVQVFEVNIRVLGSLLSAHLLMMDPKQPFGNLRPSWYRGELLEMAHDLASRLLPAFEASTTGIPYPRVNLRRGVLPNEVSDTCTAGAGSLVLEFGLLSRLLGDPVYEGYARRASKVLWNLRAKTTGLLGNMIDARSGKWLGKLSGLGAGQDSFYEYLLKSYVMFGEHDDYCMFAEAYRDIKQYMRRGRPECNAGEGEHPIYINVDMTNGAVHTPWIDSLQAAFAGIQVLGGDIEEAICSHALYYAIWKRYGVLPERWNWQSSTPEIAFYPLRPELVESTYLLYQATKNPFYLHVGMDILESLNKFTKTECGYATVHSVLDKSLEDRMESFFLSETCKYLYLLFDKDNYVNTHFTDFLFSTEGHLFPVDVQFRKEPPKDETRAINSSMKYSCDAVNDERKYFLPLQSQYLTQIASRLGLKEYEI